MNNRKLKYMFTLCLSLVAFGLNAQHTVKVNTPEGRTFTISGDSTKANFKATIAKYEGRYADAARYKVKALESGELTNMANAYYSAACYMSLAESPTEALQYLENSLTAGYSDIAHVIYDSDLDALKGSKEWKKLLKPYKKAYFKKNSEKLASMYNEDQSARLSGKVDWKKLNKEDSVRRFEVLDIIEKKKLSSAHDYYKAAMIMHHGTEAEDYKLAHDLALQALELDNPHQMSPWLAAATKDRYLLKVGKPQWFGTQGMQFMQENRKMGMAPDKIDTTAVTPEQRKAWNAPSLEKIKAYLDNYAEAMALKEKGKNN